MIRAADHPFPDLDEFKRVDRGCDFIVKLGPYRGGDEVSLGTDPRAADSDGDGIDDTVETTRPDGTGPGEPVDTDEDGTIDALDTDSDGDGTNDVSEGTGDNDGDGTPDYRDPKDEDGPDGDLDNDCVTNSVERSLGINAEKSDSDGDGISDGVETNGGNSVDTDGDGLSDADEGVTDANGNSVPDYVDTSTTDSPTTTVPTTTEPATTAESRTPEQTTTAERTTDPGPTVPTPETTGTDTDVTASDASGAPDDVCALFGISLGHFVVCWYWWVLGLLASLGLVGYRVFEDEALTVLRAADTANTSGGDDDK